MIWLSQAVNSLTGNDFGLSASLGGHNSLFFFWMRWIWQCEDEKGWTNGHRRRAMQRAIPGMEGLSTSGKPTGSGAAVACPSFRFRFVPDSNFDVRNEWFGEEFRKWIRDHSNSYERIDRFTVSGKWTPVAARILDSGWSKLRQLELELPTYYGNLPTTTMSRDDEKTELNDMFDNDEDEKEPLLSSYNSSPSPSPEPQSESESESGHPDDAKFTQPPEVSRLKRISLLIFLAILCWLAYSNVLHSKRKPKIIHASRSVLNR